MEKKALIGMSGGVDSSVAAWLMKENGYSCIGCTLELLCDANPSGVKDARDVAEGMGIPFRVCSLQKEFKEAVMEPFARVYEEGGTPNPCIECNRSIKFGRMLEIALELGCDTLVTGHYARIRFDEALGRYLLCKAVDPGKDQTYFLYTLTQEQLKHIQFPLGALHKQEVRQIAQDRGFLNARKRDSQDICFVPDGDYVAFLERFSGKTYLQGEFLDLQGKTLGTHRGAVAYTLGQRKGLGLAMGAPVYVCRKDMARNTVTVGPQEALFTQSLIAGNVNWFPFPALEAPLAVTAKTRHSQHEQAALVSPLEGGRILVTFDTPQRAVTPGQAVVMYQGDTVIGGGTILEAIP